MNDSMDSKPEPAISDELQLPESKHAKSPKMICNRSIDEIDKNELTKIVSMMKSTELSECKFLKQSDDIIKIIDADRQELIEKNIDRETIIKTFMQLVTEMKNLVNKKRDQDRDMTTGMVREINDGANNMTSMLDMLFKKGGLERIRSQPGGGVHMININDASGANSWKPGLPDPFVYLPVRNPEWSTQSRRCAAIVHKHVPYVIAEVIWNGSQRCPFQHPDDSAYHGYEYGDRDYLIIAPGFDDRGRPRDMLQVVSDLSLHMITNHDFWGSGHYRIDPIKFANLLGIGPDPIKSPIFPETLKDNIEI